jgi:hypothetical protein
MRLVKLSPHRDMNAAPELEYRFEAAPVDNEPGTMQRLRILLRGEAQLILRVSIKLAAALLILEGLTWISAWGERGAPDAMTAAVERPAAARMGAPADASPVTQQQ